MALAYFSQLFADMGLISAVSSSTVQLSSWSNSMCAISITAPCNGSESLLTKPCCLYFLCDAIGNTDTRVAEAAASLYEGAMSDHRFQDVWKQQCEAARSIRVQHGILSALDYLIGEKLMIYADTAVTRPEFARELPRFVAEIRDIFSGEEIRHYLDHLARMAAIEDEQAADENDDEDDFLEDSAEQRAAKRVRFAQLRELLTSTVLGTG
jgi:hypothetical protein